MKGIKTAGDAACIGPKTRPANADISVIWGWRQPEISKPMLSSNRHVLVIERGFIQPRHEWCSLTFNGLNGRGEFAPAGDDGERWERHFAHHLRPWREGGHYALVIGQVPGDAALCGTDVSLWAQDQTTRLIALGHKVVYRPHPLVPTPCPRGATLSNRSLEDDLKLAHRVVCFSSTTAVESVLAGVPTVVTDIGSVAYPMASHRVEDPLVRPDRTKWCHDLAWRQWSLDELASGAAWRHVRTAIHA